MSLKIAGQWTLTHLSSLLLVLVIVWTVGKPHAEDFIETTVDKRFKIVEGQQQRIIDEHVDLVDQVQSMERAVKDATKKQEPIIKNQERIIRLLEAQ